MLEAQDLEMIKQMIVESVSAAVKPPTKRKYTKKKLSSKTAKKLDKPPKRVIMEEAVPAPGQPRIRKVGRIMNQTQEVRGKHGKQCRTESFQPIENRPNNFLKTAEAKMFKNDSAIDKKLWGKNQPVPRRSETELWEVDCQVCHRPTVVSPSMVMEDPDTHEIIFTCDHCIRR